MSLSTTPAFRAILLASALSMGLTVLPAAAQSGSVVEQAQKIAELGTFGKLVQQAGLESALQGDVTVFAPSDDAFKALPAATQDRLAKDPEFLKSVLSFHAIQGATKASGIAGSSNKASLQGSSLNISRAGDFITVENAMVVRADVVAGSSVIHVIDTVMLPPAKK